MVFFFLAFFFFNPLFFRRFDLGIVRRGGGDCFCNFLKNKKNPLLFSSAF
jgi:hypothetical protein